MKTRRLISAPSKAPPPGFATVAVDLGRALGLPSLNGRPLPVATVPVGVAEDAADAARFAGRRGAFVRDPQGWALRFAANAIGLRVGRMFGPRVV